MDDDWLDTIDLGELPAEPEPMDPGFAELLAKIESSAPRHGALSWDGERRVLTTTFRVRSVDGCIRFLRQFTPEQQRKSTVDVFYQNGEPTLVQVKAGTGTLPAALLREYAARAGVKP